MADLTVRRVAHGRTVRQLVLALVLLGASLAVCWSYQRSIYSRLMGPAITTVDELTALRSADSSSRSLVETHAAGATRLSFRDVTVRTRRGRETGRSFNYFFVVPGGQGKPHLLLRADVDSLAFPVVAQVTQASAETRARIAQYHPQLLTGAGVAPVMLEVEDPAFSFDSILAAIAAIAPFLFLGMLIHALMRMMDFRRVPAVAALKRFGEPVNQVVAKIDGELKAGNSETAIKSVLLTPSWLVHKHRSKMELVRLEDVIWLYSSVTTKKIYGLIPYSWSHALHLGDRNGKVVEIKGGKKKVPEVATAILERVPWVIGGYSDDFQQVYRKNRKLMIDAVDERRQTILHAPAAAGAGPTSGAPLP